MNLEFRDDQLCKVLKALKPSPPKKQSKLDRFVKTSQAVLLVAAAIWALTLSVLFEPARQIISQQKERAVLEVAEINRVNAERKVAEEEIQRKIDSAPGWQVLEEDLTYRHLSDLGKGSHRWMGTFTFALRNPKDYPVKIQYSVVDFFLGKLHEELAPNRRLVVINPPPTAFSYTRSQQSAQIQEAAEQSTSGRPVAGSSNESPEKRDDQQPLIKVDWERIASLGSVESDLLKETACIDFFDLVNGTVLEEDRYLVSTLNPGESVGFSLDFEFVARIGDYVGTVCSYGIDANFRWDEFDDFTVLYYRIDEPN